MDIDPDLRAECEAAGLLDPIDPNPPTLAELLEELQLSIRRYIASFN